MPKYVTTNYYRAMTDEGIINLASLSNTTLAAAIRKSESEMDAAVGFDLRLGGFEAHTVYGYQEAFDWTTRRTRVPNFPTPIRQVLSYGIQVSNMSSAGAGFFATIQPGDVAFNAFSGYMELVPLTSVVYSLSPVIIQFGLRPPISKVDFEVGFFLPVWGETLVDSGDHTTYYAENQFWAQTYTLALSLQPSVLPPIPPNVYINGVKQGSGYTINYSEGGVMFTSAQSGSAVITADYTSTIPREVRDAAIAQTTWNLALRQVTQLGALPYDYTRLGDQQVRRKDANMGGTGALCDDALSMLDPYITVPIG